MVKAPLCSIIQPGTSAYASISTTDRAMQQRASPPPPWAPELPRSQSPRAPELPRSQSPRAFHLPPPPRAAVVDKVSKRKDSEANQQKQQSAKRKKLPPAAAARVSPMVPARSTGVRMMLSPRLPLSVRSPATTTSPATVDISSSNDVIDVSDNENDETEKKTIAMATKKFRSKCWQEFEPVLEDGVVVQARCKHCDHLMGAKRGHGTSALLNHLKRCKKHSSALRIVQDLSSTLRSPSGRRLKDWRYDPDLLAVPASSVPSESAFSMARRTISDFRSSLTPETVEALICSQDWYRAEGSTENFSTAAIDDLIMEKDLSSSSQVDRDEALLDD